MNFAVLVVLVGCGCVRYAWRITEITEESRVPNTISSFDLPVIAFIEFLTLFIIL